MSQPKERPAKRREFVGSSNLLAINPSAFGFGFDEPSARRSVDVVDGVAVVRVTGPLCATTDSWGWWDSYPEIEARFREAIELSPKAIELHIDSPGGDVSGCFEAARAIAEMVDAAGIPYTAKIKGQCCSAGYALAVSAPKIECSSTSLVGSIGVIDTLCSWYRYDQENGFDTAVIASGNRKADGHPGIPLTDEAKASVQKQVNDLAEVFWAWVAERRGMTAEAVRDMQANVYVGKYALAQGLVDSISGVGSSRAASNGGSMESEIALEDVIEVLRVKAEAGDEKAARALKALEDEPAEEMEEGADEDGDEDSEPVPANVDEDEPKAESREDEPEEEPTPEANTDEGDEPKAMKALKAQVTRLAARQLHSEKLALLNTRKDISAEARRALLSPSVSMDVARSMVASIPKPKKANPLAAATAQSGVVPKGTNMQSKVNGLPGAPVLTGDGADIIKQAFGLRSQGDSSIRMEGAKQVIRALTPTEARKQLALAEQKVSA